MGFTRSLFVLIRPLQWTKNLFIFLPLFFNGQFLFFEKLFSTSITFISFSLMASAIYCLNDIIDAPIDKLHPKKRNRPLAKGVISRSAVIMVMGFLVISSLGLQYFYGTENRSNVLGILLIYLFINVLYCFYLKKKTLIDVFIIAFGFVLRIYAGGVTEDIFISHWIVLMTFLLALFLAFAKRRDDFIFYEKTGVVSRKNILRYNLSFLDQALTIVGTITLVCYIMYSVSIEVISRFESDKIYLTSVFVLAGILRYLQLTIVDSRSSSPTEILLNEPIIQLCLIAWIASFIVILYF